MSGPLRRSSPLLSNCPARPGPGLQGSAGIGSTCGGLTSSVEALAGLVRYLVLVASSLRREGFSPEPNTVNPTSMTRQVGCSGLSGMLWQGFSVCVRCLRYHCCAGGWKRLSTHKTPELLMAWVTFMAARTPGTPVA